MNLHKLLLQTAQKYPNNIAYHYVGKERTYDQFIRDIEFCAGALERRGISQGDKIALLLPNCEEFLLSYYAITSLGAAVVPINPTYSPQEIAFILRDAQVKGVVAMGTIAEGFLKMAEEIPSIRTLKIFTTHSPVPTLESIQDLVAEEQGVTQWPEVQGEDVAVILYTSGTTGKPKGAMLTHQNILANAEQSQKIIDFKPEDSNICVLPMFHVFCMTVCMNMPILTGGKIIILPRFSPREVVNTIAQQKAMVFTGVPTMFNMILNLPEVNKEDLSSLKYCVSGGASLPITVLYKFQETFDVIILEGYGLSEASPVCTFNPINLQKPGSIGVPVADIEMKVIDGQGNVVPNLQVGEILVKGPNVMKGYFNNEEATNAAIKDGWLHTGDLGYRDNDNYFYIVDRKKDMIIVGGYNVYPREVEEVLYQMPQVEEAVVVGVPDEVYGEIVRAYIKLKEGRQIPVEEVVEYCKQNLAKYKVPKETTIVAEIPKNSTGKILRRLLKES